jgi:hypothetical protein
MLLLKHIVSYVVRRWLAVMEVDIPLLFQGGGLLLYKSVIRSVAVAKVTVEGVGTLKHNYPTVGPRQMKRER